MKKIIEILKKWWKIILVIILVIVGIIYSRITFFKEEVVEEIVLDSSFVSTFSETEKLGEEKMLIYVDVKGAVKKPGVYVLEEGSRVIDAIEKSGGLSKGADTSVINLSKKLEDGNVIIIYTKDRINEIKKQEVVIEYIEKECLCPDHNNKACITDEEIIIEKDEFIDDSLNSNIKISLNKANEEELMTLPGIGSSKAQDIIKYRQENGVFKSIEDIKNVKGIGEALFEKIKEHITV